MPPVATPPATSPLVLIVDPFADAREMYAEYLEFRGYRVATAATGAEALTRARADKPALILMDTYLPEMSGSDTLRAMRADPALVHTPIVAFTTNAMEHERAAARRVGFDAVIPKPCLPDDLITAIQPYLARLRRH
jgi:CheY-like chemotaxis protein